MAFPSRPAEHADPWYIEREAYDEAVENAFLAEHDSDGTHNLKNTTTEAFNVLSSLGDEDSLIFSEGNILKKSVWGSVKGLFATYFNTLYASISHQHAGTGTNSVALGVATTSTNDQSVAIGHDADATGQQAVAIGRGSQATANDAIAIGDSAAASGANGIAIGDTAATSGGDAVSIGVDSDAGFRSVAIGAGTQATDTQSVAIGYAAVASGFQSFALGTTTESAGDNTTALGAFASVPADSPRSMALGWSADVPASTPDTGVIKVNDVQQVRSDGTGVTRYGLASPDGTTGWITVTDDDRMQVNGALVNSRIPNYKELQALSGVRNFNTGTHGLGSVYEGVSSFIADTVYFIPICFESNETITNVSMNVQGAGAGGAVIRAGLFTGNVASGAAEGGSTLQTLVADWGTQAADSTGTKNWSSLTQAVSRGWYWFGFVCSDSAVTTHTSSSPYGFDGASLTGRPNNCHIKLFHGAGAAAFGVTETPSAGSSTHPAFTFRLS